MLDGVVHVVRRDLDREPDPVLRQLLYLDSHVTIQADPLRATSHGESLDRGAGAAPGGGELHVRGMDVWVWVLMFGVTAIWAAMLGAVAFVVVAKR
jgi:hypothetical protein